MKTLLIFFFLFFSSSVLSDDISDFQIEGISIGDSLLDYMSENEILKEFELGKDDYHWTDKKFANVYIYKASELYEYMSATVKKNDNKYIIHGLRGMIDYQNINKCFKKQTEIVEELSTIFKNTEKTKEEFKNSADSTGQSIVYANYFILSSGDEVEVTCYTFSEHVNSPDGLDVGLATKEFVNWLVKFAKY
tara:strand:+ start:99 stop:674 length:576 start_codon:yes stop_codon:yes gene_type:complete